MYEHHQLAIDNITRTIEAMPNVLGLIIDGSVAHGLAKADSDIDVMIVVSEDEYQSRVEGGTHVWCSDQDCKHYEGGYMDAKFVSPSFIRAVGERGTEIARFAFKDGWLAFSRLPELPGLLEAACRYPEEGVEERIKSFHAQMFGWMWYYGEGVRKGFPYLIRRSSTQVALFGARLILARNRMLYPYHKWLPTMLSKAVDKPENIMELFDAVVDTAQPQALHAFTEAIDGMGGWGITRDEWGPRFVHDAELNWMRGPVDIADW